MEELHSWWEVPAIAHFCHLFRTAFNLFHFEVEELEASLLQEAVDDYISVENFIIRLLPACCKTENIKALDWRDQLFHLLEKKWSKEKGLENPFTEQNVDFSCLPLRTKVDILYSLCIYRFDAEDVPEALKNMDSEDLRTVHVGTDSEKNVYWYFSGIRLYKEDTTKRRTSLKQKKTESNNLRGGLNGYPTNSKNGRTKRIASQKKKQDEANKSAWSVACYSFEDWNVLVKTLKKSRNFRDKQLSVHIEEKFLPVLPSIINKQERELRKRIMELAPRRSSARIDSVRRRKEVENVTATKAAEDERAKRAAEDEKRAAEDEKVKKQREKEDRAKRAAERANAIEARAKRAKLREQHIYSDLSESLSGSRTSTRNQTYLCGYNNSDSDDESSENGSEQNEGSDDRSDGNDMEKSEHDTESENEESSSESEGYVQEKIFSVMRHVPAVGNSSKYGQNYSTEHYNETCEVSRTQGNGAIVHRFTNYTNETKSSPDNLLERNAVKENHVDGNHNGVEEILPKENRAIQKIVSASYDKRFSFSETEPHLRTYEKKVHQDFYLRKEQNSAAEAKFDLLNGMPNNFSNMHHQVIK